MSASSAIKTFSTIQITFLQPPLATKEDLKQQAHWLFRQAVFMLQNDLILDCRRGYAKRPRTVSTSIIIDPKTNRGYSKESDSGVSVGSVRRSER